MAFQKIDGAHTAEAIGITVAKILKPVLGTLLLFLFFYLHHIKDYGDYYENH